MEKRLVSSLHVHVAFSFLVLLWVVRTNCAKTRKSPFHFALNILKLFKEMLNMSVSFGKIV